MSAADLPAAERPAVAHTRADGLERFLKAAHEVADALERGDADDVLIKGLLLVMARRAARAEQAALERAFDLTGPGRPL